MKQIKIGFDYYPEQKKYCLIKTEFHYYLDATGNKIYHRDGGPAIIIYSKSRYVCQHIYFNHDQWHRNDGPAIIDFTKSGKIKSKTYYYNGYCIHVNNQKQFKKYIKTLLIS